jgi:hypothetical protein
LQGYSSEKVSVAIYEVTQATVEAPLTSTYVKFTHELARNVEESSTTIAQIPSACDAPRA